MIKESIIISLFYIGLRIITSKGMIGYFMRKPFENLIGWKQYVMKPLLMCVTCFASFYTIVISYFYFEPSQWTILQVFIVATLNSIIFAYYEKLQK